MTDAQRVIVIGSGPCGAMAAHELVRQGIPVTMLESGLDAPSGVLVRVMGRNVFRRVPPLEARHPTHPIPAGDTAAHWWYNLSPGGLSNQWTGAVPRFAPEDFFEGERLHERYRWPVTLKDLIPYYEQVERLIYVTSTPKDVPSLPASCPTFEAHLHKDWEQIAEKAAAHGQGLTVMPLADGPRWSLVRRGTAFNSFSVLVEPLLTAPGFQLITGAHALKLEYSSTKSSVEAVIYQDRKDGSQHRLEASAIVVACGALHSTKLLFDSACDTFPNGLGNSEGVLGLYLHDHPRDWWTFEVEKPLTRPAPPAYLTRTPYDDSCPLMAASWTIGLTPGLREKLLSFTRLRTNAFGVQVFGTMIPSEQHYVRPDETTKDDFGLPALHLCIKYDTATVENMLSARSRLLSILDEAGYKSRLLEVPTELVPGDSVHYGGTIRMHQSRKYGMLDAWNRLYDIPNVLVVDASCFTTGPEKNPTLTAMAFSARASARLADDLRTGKYGEI